MRKLLSIFMLINFICLAFLITSCKFDPSNVNFREGRYIYSAEMFNLFDEIYIDEVVIEIVKCKDDSISLKYETFLNTEPYDKCKYPNLIKNRNNNENYSINLYYKLHGNDEYSFIDIYYLYGYSAPNTYLLLVDLSSKIELNLQYVFDIEFVSEYGEILSSKIQFDIYDIFLDNKKASYDSKYHSEVFQNNYYLVAEYVKGE